MASLMRRSPTCPVSVKAGSSLILSVAAGAEDVERVRAGLTLPVQAEQHAPERAALEAQRDRRRVLDVTRLDLALREQDARRGDLNAGHLSRHGALEIELVAATLEQVPASAARSRNHVRAAVGPGADTPSERQTGSVSRVPRAASSRASVACHWYPIAQTTPVRLAASAIALASASVRAIGFSRRRGGRSS